MSDRVPITYTFGNHMHWVDMEWLWGYHVLPGSVRDMLHFCRETGAKGNVNFDGVGYEKLAIENPEAFGELRQAIQDGRVEIVGGSYGQPYGLFHGGESNIRQRVYGARTAQRLFGKRPVTFWEEEFDFFPQLPQMLAGCGFKYASLFFQWTWHTPEVPKEDVPVVWWEGQDGSRLLTATRNRLNLHQWPEDIQVLMDELAETGGQEGSLILQWLELMPSPDWMCRSEVLLPKTRELLGDPRFNVRFATLGEYLASTPGEVPTRRYGMDDAWHGMTLGKNGDRMRHLSRECEASLLAAEAASAIAGLFGRPYAQWDVYPTWELEESWRELLQAQHHDNDECEGLCGHVGRFSYQRSRDLSESVSTHATQAIMSRVTREVVAMPCFNTLGWPVKDNFGISVPPFGYGIASGWGRKKCFELRDSIAVLKDQGIEICLDLEKATVTHFATDDMDLVDVVGPLRLGTGEEVQVLATRPDDDNGEVNINMVGPSGAEIRAKFDYNAPHQGLDVSYTQWWSQELLSLGSRVPFAPASGYRLEGAISSRIQRIRFNRFEPRTRISANTLWEIG